MSHHISWNEKSTYGDALVERYLRPLQEARRREGAASMELQLRVLRELQCYFAADMRERAPTVIVDEPMAIRFHELVRQVMSHVEVAAVELLDPQGQGIEVLHALWSYLQPQAHGPVGIDAFDHDQQLLRLSYYVHGTPPAEVFRVDDKPVAPVYSKYRGVRFFRRMLLRQRIAWIPVSGARTLEMTLNGLAQSIGVGAQGFRAAGAQVHPSEVLAAARAVYPRGKGGRKPLPGGLAGLKARALRWLATSWPVRRAYGGAWVFVDRNENADDNAEHLYRWIARHRPEVRPWFLLNRNSHDWDRLAAEGFRVLAPGLRRRLLLLNSDHIISSHAEYEYGGFDRAVYGDLMNWRYTFLQHGVIYNDLSHWLNGRTFDIFVTSSPAEDMSIAGDDSPYSYTNREVRRTGLPRHDRLLGRARETPPDQIDSLLIMPTWRGALVDARLNGAVAGDAMSAVMDSDYVRHWRSLLRSERLRSLAASAHLRIVFLPHANSEPFLEAFEVPGHIEVASTVNSSVQALFCRSAIFVTDYTSVAFEMALLRRPVFYFQFDRDQFFSGGHNWRQGYFDYDSDGFGPVAFSAGQLIENIAACVGRGATVDPLYRARMEKAMPDQSAESCRRVYERIASLKAPVGARPPLPAS